MLKEDEAYLGLKPDAFHLGGWVDHKNEHGGDYNSGDYAPENFTGGADVLRAAVRQTQEGRDPRVSLHDSRPRGQGIADRQGPRSANRPSDGRRPVQQDEHCWYVCIGDKQWRDYYIAALKRAQKETGADAIYVDVFGYTRGYACHSKEHGHEMPLNVNRACYQLIRRLRQELPAGVAIWSEFLLPDVNSQFTSGKHHLLLPHPARLHAAVVRFARPGAGVYAAWPKACTGSPSRTSSNSAFPCGFETGPRSHDLRALFFNGEGVDDVGWLLYDSRDLVRVRNWLAIEREFADCFASLHPEPLVATEAGEVYANEFPGEGRTAWTVFNARFSTYRGPVLSVEHRPGDTYYDAWNHKPLRPEIRNGRATISVSLDPQGLGCVVRTRRGAQN